MTKPVFFATPAEFRQWLEKHAATADDLLVGFHKKGSGRPSITWPESVDEALSFGWIDGVRRSLGEESYTIRFTPRRSGSIWSSINVRRAEALIAEGRMTPAGLAAFEARDPEKTGVYSFENRPRAFDEASEKRFRKNRTAWKFWESLPPGYRRTVTWWVMGAKKAETRERRLAQLIELCAEGKRVPMMGDGAKKKG